MEDAMIINKSAYERGFCHGTVYNSESIELPVDSYFARNPAERHLEACLGSDGFPQSGQLIVADEPFYWYFFSLHFSQTENY
jgi:DNA-directed RNA polymerase I subunit RPA2